MSEHLTHMEAEVEKRYCDFVDEHAERALWWTIREGIAARDPAIPILGIEFGTDWYNRSPSPGEVRAAFHHMDIYLAQATPTLKQDDSPRLLGKTVIIEQSDKDRLSINGEANRMRIFNGGHSIDDRYYSLHSMEGFMDELEWLEKTGAFVPTGYAAPVAV